MSKYSKQNSIRVAFIAEGSSCRFDDNSDEIIKEEIDKRNQFGLNALKVLGVKNVEFYNHKCGNLDQVSILKINKIIENEINNFKPNVLFTHSLKMQTMIIQLFTNLLLWRLDPEPNFLFLRFTHMRCYHQVSGNSLNHLNPIFLNN